MSSGTTKVGWIDLIPHKSPDSKALRERKESFRGLPINPALAPQGPIGPHDPNLWRAVGIIGETEYRTYSTWEWAGDPSSDPNAGRCVTLKTEKTSSKGKTKSDLDHEGRLLDRFIAEGRTDHLMTMVYRGPDYHKLYLEHGLHSTLESDLLRRWERLQGKSEAGPTYYSEEQLWRMFQCLVKGSISLEGGRIENPRKNSLVVHFDLRPQTGKSSPQTQSSSAGFLTFLQFLWEM